MRTDLIAANPEQASTSPRPRRRARVEVPKARRAKPRDHATAAPMNRPAPSPKATPPSTTDRRGPKIRTPSSARGERFSALDAAALVLAQLPAAQAAAGLTTGELIERMAAQSLWLSPGGKTPAATLYAAMAREIATKQSAARFRKAGPGHFALVSAGGKGPAKPAPRAARKVSA